MAQCKLTPREFIGNAFSPQIAAVCSAAAEATCQKNNLSFIELLQPFCNLNCEGHIKDPQGATVTVRNLRLSIHDVNVRPPEPTLARKMLNESVSSAPCERTTTIRIGSVDLDIPVSVPWFESWREMFLDVQFPSDHEFTKHFLACMIVVSTAEDNPLEKIQHMGSQLHQSVPGKLPKWFNNNALRYYILVYDVTQDDKNKAEVVFTEMKNIYRANNCFLLQMNSRPPGHPDANTHLPDPWSQFLLKHGDLSTSADQGSSPRTPADTGGVSGMPSEVTTEPDKTSHAGTPVVSRNPMLGSPDATDRISLSSEVLEPTSQLEVGQEAVPVATTVHPLTPDAEMANHQCSGEFAKSPSDSSPINANVWADSPNFSSPTSVQHGARLSTQDLERLRSMISEFCLKSLLPYVEKQIALLNEVISNKKGVSRSLFSATKRWFGTNKPGVAGSAPSNAVIYTAESSELQLRRLGDLCFMFGHYSLAYQAYHSAKRDFAADQAWLYYAGALEMAALSAFMQGETNRKTIEYMDDAILTYLNSCRMPQFATRATLLSAECLKGRGLYGEAAKQLIRMTSEDSDLRSALLLEQAAYCFIGPKMTRKYAFHAVLAGHRFSKAGQRKHSLRCYKQAYQVYTGKGWSLAEDHIHFTIGRQAASLKHVVESVKAFDKLLNASSRQAAPQQAAFLREFLHTHNLLREEGTSSSQELPVLPLPLVDTEKIKVLFGYLGKPVGNLVPASHVSFDSTDSDDERWGKLEETVITVVQGTAPMIFRPTIALYSEASNNASKPNAVIDEPVHFSVELHNPLHIPLPLSDVKLLWSFSREEETVNNEISTEDTSTYVSTQVVEAIVLQPVCKQCIVLSLTPRAIGELKVTGIGYKLSNPSNGFTDQPVVNPSVGVAGKRDFQLKGPKLKNVKEKPGVQTRGQDLRLDLRIVEKSPFLQISFTQLSPEMLCGEIQRVEVTFKNIGNAALRNIHVASTNAKLFTLEGESNERLASKVKSPVTRIPIPESETLNVGDTFSAPLWVRTPHKKGSHRLDLLFYYENVEKKSIPRYRLCRHVWHLTVLDSIQITARASRSAVNENASPTLNLLVKIKNTNQVHDPFMNEIELTRVSLQSDSWLLFEKNPDSRLPSASSVRVQPQETYHLLLKARRKFDRESTFSDIPLSEEQEELLKPVTASPFIDFVRRRNIGAIGTDDRRLEIGDRDEKGGATLGDDEDRARIDTMALKSTLIIRWKAKVSESGTVTRQAIGQHHVDLQSLNKSYTHPEDVRVEQTEYSSGLRIFGPDRNVPDATTGPALTRDPAVELELAKNLLSYQLLHARHETHDFQKNRLCVVPVEMVMLNHSQAKVQVRVTTIGTSSQTHLPSIKSQLYSPQASTYFRYACHTSINCEIEPLDRRNVQLRAVLPSPGTYDLASRVEVSVRRAASEEEFLPQKWRIESICIIDDDRHF